MLSHLQANRLQVAQLRNLRAIRVDGAEMRAPEIRAVSGADQLHAGRGAAARFGGFPEWR